MHSSKTKLTCVPSPVDPDHWVFEPEQAALASPPDAVDLRLAPGAFPPVYDQGELNSCTANAVAAALFYDQRRQKLASPFAPSRLFVYYNERDREGTIGLDVQRGRPVQMIDCIETVHEKGICPEEMWPYDERRFDVKPPDDTYALARAYCSQSYHRVIQDLAHLKACLAQGYPFLFGVRIFQRFLGEEAARTGVIPMPAPGEEPVGGHAMLAVGYDDSRQSFIVRNSFGDDWGEAGHCLMPYEYLLDSHLAFDHWVIQQIGEEERSTAPAPRRVRDVVRPSSSKERHRSLHEQHLDAVSGRVAAWSVHAGESACTPPVLDDRAGVLCFGTDSGLCGADASDGRRLWSLPVTGAFSRPVAGGGVFHVLTAQESLIEINARSGEKEVVAAFAGLVQPGQRESLAAPAVNRQWIIAASPAGEVRIASRLDQGKVYTVQTGPGPAALHMARNTLYLVAGEEGRRELHAIDLGTASPRTIRVAPIVSDLYSVAAHWLVCMHADGLALYDLNSGLNSGQNSGHGDTAGEQAGTLITPRARFAMAPDELTGFAARAEQDLCVVTTRTGQVLGLSLATLRRRWKTAIPAPSIKPPGTSHGKPPGAAHALHAPVLAHDRVHVTSHAGVAAALRAHTGELCGLFFEPAGIATRPLVNRATVYFACADHADSRAATSGAVRGVVLGHTYALDLGAHGPGEAFALVRPRDRTPLHVMDTRKGCVEAWINTRHGGGVLSIRARGERALDLWLGESGTLHLASAVKTQSGWQGSSAQARTLLCDGRWHHVAVSFSAEGRIVLYVDGMALDQVTRTSLHGAPAMTDELDITIGASIGPDGKPTRFYRGLIAEVRVWDTYRVAAEISETMHSKLCGDEPGLAAYWDFDRCAIHDRSRQGHDGSLTSSSLHSQKIGSARYWLCDLGFDHPSYPYLTTQASPVKVNAKAGAQAGEAQAGEAQAGKAGQTIYELVVRAHRADGAPLAHHPIQIRYHRHDHGEPGSQPEPDAITISAGQKSALLGGVSVEHSGKDSVFATATDRQGRAVLRIATTDPWHSPWLGVSADATAGSAALQVNVGQASQTSQTDASPLLLAQSKLIQDYHVTDKGIDATSDHTTYRAVITASNADGSLRPYEPITLWAQSTTTVTVNGQKHDIDASKQVALTADEAGELVVVVMAGDIQTPSLCVRAGFMHAGEQVVIAPDEDLHGELAVVQGSDMSTPRMTAWTPDRTDKDDVALLAGDYAPHANDIAQAMRDLLATVKTGSSSSQSGSQALGLARSGAKTRAGSRPPRRRLEHMQQPARHTPVDRVTCLRTHAHINRERPITPEAIKASLGGFLGFSFECHGSADTLKITRLATRDEVERAMGTPTTATPPLGSAFSKAWKKTTHSVSSAANDVAKTTTQTANQVAKTTTQATNQVAQTTTQTANQVAKTTTQATNQVAKTTTQATNQVAQTTTQAANDVAKTTTQTANQVAKTTTQAADAVATQVTKIVVSVDEQVSVAIHSAEEVCHQVLKSVSEAVTAVRNFFDQLAIDIVNVVRFFRALFDWGEIIKIHRIIKSSIKGCAKLAKQKLGDEATIRSMFTPLEKLLDSLARKPFTLAESVGGMHSSAGSSPALDSAKGVHAKTMYHKTKENGVKDMGSPAAQPKSPDSGALTLSKDLKEIVQKATALGQSFVQGSIADVGQNLIGLLEAVGKTVIDEARELLPQIAKLVGEALDGLVGFLDTTLHIPFVSDLYKWVTGDALSILDLFCLVVAVAVNVVYAAVTTLMHGKPHKFSEHEIDLPDRILDGADQTSLALGASAKSYTWGGKDTVGAEVAYICVQMGYTLFGVAADEMYVARDPASRKERGFFKMLKAGCGIWGSSLLFWLSTPEYEKRLYEDYAARGKADEMPSPTSFKIEETALYVSGLLQNGWTMWSGFKAVIYPSEASDPDSLSTKLEFPGMVCMSMFSILAMVYSILDYAILQYPEIEKYRSKDLQNETHMFFARTLCRLVPSIFSPAYTDVGMNEFVADPDSYTVYALVRGTANLFGLVFHSVGTLAFDSSLPLQ